MNGEYVLQMENIGKLYSGTRVLDKVNLSLRAGEIHAILGENGAGKSTLMNILFGMSVIHSTGGYEGRIVFEGAKRHIASPTDAMALGIGMVHQEFMLLPGFTVAENIKLNREKMKDGTVNRLLKGRFKLLDHEAMNRDARKSMKRLDMDIDEWVTVAGLPVGYKQFIEIARELDKENIKVIVFDEPTAVLTESEASVLLKAMRRIAGLGIGILFITHRLDEVMEVADTITILRDGQLVGNLRKENTTTDELATLMVGREVHRITMRGALDEDSGIILSIKNLYVNVPGERVNGVNLDVRKGEILGIGGLGGQGKIGISNGIMGLYSAQGEVCLKGDKLSLNNPIEAIARGLAMVSEDRRGVGLLLDSSIELNISVSAIHNKNKFLKKVGPISLIDKKAVRDHAQAKIRELDIRCTGPSQITRRLSGGNQQKVCIARALTLEPEVLFVSEPTRGIDVGAKKLVLETLVRLNQEQGLTIVMTSSELAELRSICDRIAIVSKGRIAGILRPDDSDAQYGLLMSGENKKIHGKEVS